MTDFRAENADRWKSALAAELLIGAQKSASIVGGQAQPLSHLIQQRLDAFRPAVMPGVSGSAAMHIRTSRRRLRNARSVALHHLDVGHQEAAQGESIVALKLGQTLKFKNAGGEAGGQGLSPESVAEINRILAARNPHRISGDAK